MATQRKTTYITCAETAKLVRAALKEAFPHTRFSVRSHTYSGGASIDIYWTDGPTAKQVQHVTSRYEGATFDAQVDLMEYHNSTLDGEHVHFGADFIFENRSFSVSFITPIAERVAARFGFPTPPVLNSDHSGAHVPDDYTQMVGGWYTLARKVMQEAENTAEEAQL
jgi:hypothetical protein